MKHGSTLPWLDTLASKAWNPEKDTADGYLVRDILSMGTALAALLDEFHPIPIVFSVGVERLVRRLVVIEGSLPLGRKDRGAFFEKKIAFMWIGGGAHKETTSQY